MASARAATRWYGWPAAVVLARGSEAGELLHRLSAQDLRPLARADGSCDALFVDHQGKLVHRATVWRTGETYGLRVPAGCGAELLAHLERYTIVEDVTYTLVGEDVPCAIVFGPQEPHGAVAPGVHAVSALAASAAGSLPNVVLPAPAALGAGFEWIGVGENAGEAGDAARTQQLSKLLGAPCDAPVTAQAWRYHRLSAGVPAYGDDFLSGVQPFVFRLDVDALAWNKGCYVGQEVLSRLDSYDKVARFLMGFEAPAEGAAWLAEAAGPIKLSVDARPAGQVTSFAARPDSATGGEGTVGLAVVARAFATDGQQVRLRGTDAAQRALPELVATLRTRPFWQGRTNTGNRI